VEVADAEFKPELESEFVPVEVASLVEDPVVVARTFTDAKET